MTLILTPDMVKTAILGCANGSQVHVYSRPQGFPFTGDPSGLRIQEVSHVNKDCALITVFRLSPLICGSDPAVCGSD
jgi:hypothetical protein